MAQDVLDGDSRKIPVSATTKLATVLENWMNHKYELEGVRYAMNRIPAEAWQQEPSTVFESLAEVEANNMRVARSREILLDATHRSASSDETKVGYSAEDPPIRALPSRKAMLAAIAAQLSEHYTDELDFFRTAGLLPAKSIPTIAQETVHERELALVKLNERLAEIFSHQVVSGQSRHDCFQALLKERPVFSADAGDISPNDDLNNWAHLVAVKIRASIMKDSYLAAIQFADDHDVTDAKDRESLVRMFQPEPSCWTTKLPRSTKRPKGQER